MQVFIKWSLRAAFWLLVVSLLCDYVFVRSGQTQDVWVYLSWAPLIVPPVIFVTLACLLFRSRPSAMRLVLSTVVGLFV